MDACKICVSPASPRKFGSIFTPHLFWVSILLTSYLSSVVRCTVKNGGATFKHHQDDDDFADFAEFDEVENSSPTPAAAKEHQAASSAKQNKEKETTTTTKTQPDDDEQEENRVPPSKKATIVDRIEVNFHDASDDLDGVVEDELDDDEEFTVPKGEDFDKRGRGAGGPNAKKATPTFDDLQPKQLKIADVPAHLRNNWSNFQVELLMLMGLAVYLINYALGKAKNHKLATYWFEKNKDVLYSNFDVVGDDGTTQEVQKNILMKESDHSYSLWCTGRPGCLGALIQLNFLKRQDLVSLITQLFKPQLDKVSIRFNLSAEDLDTCILCFGQKKTVAKLAKDATDLSQFCTEKKNAERLGLPEAFSLYAETAEVVNCVLDSKTLPVVQKYEDFIDFVHISDQYSGIKANDGETQTKLPETSRIVAFQFNVMGRMGASEKSIDDLKPLLAFSFYCLDKIRRFRLSREAKQKCDKNRLLAQESYLKQTHAQRQEAAQVRREEKARERKERVLQEEDPDKQRRLEKLEQKRQMKKKQPRIKQLKIKAG